MTLARTALRLATIECLKGATVSTGPTVANNRVYDSRISDFSPETYPADALASIIVLTDEDEGDGVSSQNGGPPFERLINLVIEFAMVQGFDLPAEGGGTTFVPGYPATDAEHEASLDLLEFQIKRRLGYDLDSLCALWRSFTRVWKFDCHRQVLDETGVKIAARVLTWQCAVSDDQVKIYNPDQQDVPTGIDILPEPLKRVAKALPAGNSLNICVALANALNPLTSSPLGGIDFTMAGTTGGDPANMFDVSIEIRSALETPQVIASGGPVVIDYAKGTFQNLILTGNVPSVAIINWPRNAKTGRIILKVTQTGNYAIPANAWPSGTEWVGGSAPTITLGAGSTDLLVLVSGSAGAEIFGNVAGQNYQQPA